MGRGKEFPRRAGLCRDRRQVTGQWDLEEVADRTGEALWKLGGMWELGYLIQTQLSRLGWGAEGLLSRRRSWKPKENQWQRIRMLSMTEVHWAQGRADRSANSYWHSFGDVYNRGELPLSHKHTNRLVSLVLHLMWLLRWAGLHQWKSQANKTCYNWCCFLFKTFKAQEWPQMWVQTGIEFCLVEV